MLLCCHIKSASVLCKSERMDKIPGFQLMCVASASAALDSNSDELCFLSLPLDGRGQTQGSSHGHLAGPFSTALGLIWNNLTFLNQALWVP